MELFRSVFGLEKPGWIGRGCLLKGVLPVSMTAQRGQSWASVVMVWDLTSICFGREASSTKVSSRSAFVQEGLSFAVWLARGRRPSGQDESWIMPLHGVGNEGGGMKQRRMTVIAVACGALCAACVAAFLLSLQGEADAARAEVLARYGGEQVEVCVATRDVAAGERLDASAVEEKLWVADLLPEGAVADASLVVGRNATSSILKGEVVLEKRFQEGQGSLDIPQGMQAVSVPAKAVQAVGGAIRPGMSVDVYSSGSSGTASLAQGVIVLASSMGENGSLVSNDAGWITLAVAPERVEEIIAASSKTNLYFALPGEGFDSALGKNGEEAGSSSSAVSDKGKGNDGSKAAKHSGGKQGESAKDSASPESKGEQEPEASSQDGGE